RDSERRSSTPTSNQPSSDASRPVFYGSVRFPASRVALWNRQAVGHVFNLDPEFAAPLLVLRASALELITSLINRRATELWNGTQESRTGEAMTWLGHLLPVSEA
ncbi:unnamed protein product, partial [Discosporangium mesarthrocarpum]